ncbi:conserved hypothetical protein [Raphidiopsis brookii D9]|nr:conserved hypothetical protein [Raphidiopsis brookii D9]
MSLLNSQSHQLASEVERRLKEVLSDIVENVEISADFSIRHPNYQPWEMPTEMLSRIQALPKEMQDKYMSLQLRSFLYGTYYNGSTQKLQALGYGNKVQQLDLENSSFAGVSMDFYLQLDKANKGEGYFDSGWSVLREETDGSLAVTKGGLRLHIQRDKHLQEYEQSAFVGDVVSILMPKNLVQNGFYMAVGNAGLQREEAMVRIYFNVTPEGAVAVMAGLTEKLNQRGIPFSFKALYNPVDYQRYDAGVLYFGKTDYELVREIVGNVYHQNQFVFKQEIPLFTLELAPGLGLAEEPDKKFGSEESFGMNRCQIIANGLLMAWQQEENSAAGRMTAICEQFSELGIDWQRPYLNADSKNVYQRLELTD